MSFTIGCFPGCIGVYDGGRTGLCVMGYLMPLVCEWMYSSAFSSFYKHATRFYMLASRTMDAKTHFLESMLMNHREWC